MERPGERGHQGRGGAASPGGPARGRVVAGAGLCLALVVSAWAAPALADPGGSGTASVGDTLRLAGLPAAGSFDPLRLDQIALRPGDDSADRTARQTVPFSVTDGTTKGSFSVEVAQPYSFNSRQVRVDQPPAVGITMGSGWPWPGVIITPYDQSQERLPLTGDYDVDVFSRFSITNNTPAGDRDRLVGVAVTGAARPPLEDPMLCGQEIVRWWPRATA